MSRHFCKRALLERAAENAYQNRDLVLANALYAEIEKVAKGPVIPPKLPLGVKLVNSVDENKKIITDLIAKFPGDLGAIRKKVAFLRAVWAKKPGGKQQVEKLLAHFDEMVKNVEETGVKQNKKS